MQPSGYSYFVLKNFRKLAEQMKQNKNFGEKIVNEGHFHSIFPLSLSFLSSLKIKKIPRLIFFAAEWGARGGGQFAEIRPVSFLQPDLCKTHVPVLGPRATMQLYNWSLLRVHSLWSHKSGLVLKSHT